MFHDDVLPGHAFAEHDHRRFRPEGWVQEGRERLELMRPYAERHGLTMLQLACAWNLAHPAVRCVAPTLIQEARSAHARPRPIEDKRDELAAVRGGPELTAEEVDAIRAIGDNSGCMTLKGASSEYEGAPGPDRWEIDDELSAIARRWSIDPARDLAEAAPVGANDK
jgi:hypothetical protein